ncbi:MAG: DUF6345 domain-containing protein [Gemmatimonadota bacterium]|nr:hypothetical protein [Gemmatimonadota bacterium]MDP6461764.1 DUF6345 domain-containing protein [Gemmatimonadota bacterium]MDP7031661.1 DUF6345 domain-containing protein [Gemmatimonadota bacterium]
MTKWNSSCSGSTRSSWDNMADAWYDDFTDSGSTPGGHSSKAWSRDGFYKNGTIVDSQFTDDDIVSWGDDDSNDNVDDVDALMVALHGSHNGGAPGEWRGSVRVDESGSGNCGAWQAHMELGDHDLEFLHLSSCHSMCDLNEGYSNWMNAYNELHQVNGFYGLMWISTLFNGRYSGFSDDAFDISIAESWADNQYSGGFWTWGYDHCPVSLVAGNSSSNASSRVSNEEYDYVYSDPGSTYFCYISISGCDPKAHP